MKIVLPALLIAFLSPLAGATSCYDTAMTQAAISDCASAGTQERDKDLNAAYKALMKRHASDKEFKEKLKKAQRAWIAYRDLDLDLVDAGGSVASMCRANRLAQLNKERTDYLESLVDAKEGDVCAP